MGYSFVTVFEIKICGTLRAVNWVIYKRLKDTVIAIYSESQAAFRELSSALIISNIIHNCRNRMNSISRFNTKEPRWVPGHYGVWCGSEIPITLAL